MTLSEIVSLVEELFQAGGLVMPPLFCCVLLLWYGLGYRFWVLKTPKKMGVRDLLSFYREGKFRDAQSIVEQAIQKGVALKKSRASIFLISLMQLSMSLSVRSQDSLF